MVIDHQNSANSNFSFKERFFLYEIETPGLITAIKEGFGAATKFAEVLGKLVDSVASGVKQGFTWIEVGVKKLSDKIADPGDLVDLEEYSEMIELPQWKEEPLIKTSVPLQLKEVGEAILQSRTKLAFLEYKTQQYTQFYNPAIQEFKIVEEKLNEIKQNNSKYGQELYEIKQIIPRYEEALKSGDYEEGTSSRTDLEQDIESKKERLKQLESLTNYTVSWNRPELVVTEFPPNTGKFEKRFKPNPNEKEKILLDLNDLYKYLEGYTKPALIPIEKYSKEINKLKYKISKTFEYIENGKFKDDDKQEIRKKIEEQSRKIYSDGIDLKNSLNFVENPKTPHILLPYLDLNRSSHSGDTKHRYIETVYSDSRSALDALRIDTVKSKSRKALDDLRIDTSNK